MTVPETEKHRPKKRNRAIKEVCRVEVQGGEAVLVLKRCALRVVVLSPAGVEGEVGLDGRIRWRVDVSQSISQQTDCQFAEQWVGESRVETGRGGTGGMDG